MMRTTERGGLLILMALAAVLLVAATASAQTKWPSALTYSIGLSSDETARVQTSAAVLGPLGGGFGAKLGAWWVTGGTDNRAFVADAYIDYQKEPVYLAAGRKFVPFGPVGILVSPGISGGELQLNWERVSLQAIAGSLAFTPVTGGTRFTFAGSRSPTDEDIRAGRIAVKLTAADSAVPVTVGLNGLDLMDDTGRSADISIDATNWLNLFGETADFGDVEAKAYGVRLSNQQLHEDPSQYTMLSLYYREVPAGFLPAAIGATQYFEDEVGWAGGVYHQFNDRHGLGMYLDGDDAILTLFGYVPL